MRICILDSSDFISYPVGGQLSFLRDFILEAVKKNLEISLAGVTRHKKEVIGKWTSRKIGSKEIPFLPFCRVSEHSNYGLVPRRLQILLWAFLNRRKLQERRYDVLYFHTPELLLPFLFPKLCNIVVHTHGLWEHTSEFSRYKWVRNKILDALFKRYVKFALQRSDEVIVVNRESLKIYESLFPNQKEKLLWIPTAVDVNLFYPMERSKARKFYGFCQEEVIIIFVGRLSWNKGLDLLLDSFQLLSTEIPMAKLLLVGDGELRNYLADRAYILKIEKRTVFLGERPRSELSMILNCADILALTSFVEGLPMIVLETLACGIPTVAVNVGDVNRLIIEGVTGFIVEGRDPQQFKNKILDCLRKKEMMKEECLKMSQEYAMSAIAQILFKVFEKYNQ